MTTTVLSQTLTYEPHYTITYPCNPLTNSSSAGQTTTVKPPAWTQWTQAQEKMLANDYPFDVHATDPEDYLNRCYLQWLWLPESIMPLRLFVPCLRHLQTPRQSQPPAELQEPHPMHEILEPLLRTTRIASSKYHTDLLRVLNGEYNEEADMEESMMWFAVGYEPHASTKGKGKDAMEEEDVPWRNEAWRDNYLQKMERREALIQILLYMYKQSLPGPTPIKASSSPSRNRKQRGSPSRSRKSSRKWSPSRVLDEPVLTEEDHLESFMDKLSMWQLMGGLDVRSGSEPDHDLSGGFSTGITTSNMRKGEKPRDWAQAFCEDIVEKEFKDKVPDLCALLRSKVFPMPVFSDDEHTEPAYNGAKKNTNKNVASGQAPSLTRRPSISATSQKPGLNNNNSRSLSRAPSNRSVASSQTLSRAPSRARFPSPLPMDNDIQMADGTSSQLTTNSNPTNPIRRSRSLSLSQSLAQEQLDRERGTTLHAPSNARKRSVLTREVSMSRSFKRKASGTFGESQGDGLTAIKRDGIEKEDAITKEKEKEKKKRELERGVTLVEETPVKRPRIEPARVEREQGTGSVKPLKALDLSAAMPRPPGASWSNSQLQPPVQSTSRLPSKSKTLSPSKSPSLSPPHSPSPPPRQSRSRELSPDIFLPPSLPPSSPPSQSSSQPLMHDMFSGNESPLTDFDESSSETEKAILQKTAHNKALSRVKTKSFKRTAEAAPDDDDDDEWTIESSPDITLLNPKTGKSTKITNLKLLGPRPSPLKGKSTTASDMMDVDEDEDGDEDEVETQLAGEATTTEAELSEESAKTSKSTAKTKSKVKTNSGTTKPSKKKASKPKKAKDTAEAEEGERQTPSLKIHLDAHTTVLKASPSMKMEVVIKTPTKASAKRGRRK